MEYSQKRGKPELVIFVDKTNAHYCSQHCQHYRTYPGLAGAGCFLFSCGLNSFETKVQRCKKCTDNFR
jgi:hypothetical protein